MVMILGGLIGSASAPAFAFRELLDEKILAAFSPIDPDKYAELKALLESRHTNLKIRFVAAKGNPNFTKIAPELWEKTYDFEDFSHAAAFGRTLCPRSARNLNSNEYQIIVQADEPGDTLLHEYLHYLQAQEKESKLCELYARLEKTPTNPQDILANQEKEYEVVRFLYENQKRLAFTLETRAQLLEKIMQYLPVQEKLNKKWQWSALRAPQLARETEQVIKDFIAARKTLSPYQIKTATVSSAHNASAKVVKGISLLPQKSKVLLPFCVSTDANFKALPLLRRALDNWNELSQKTLRKNLFALEDCPPSGRALKVVSDASGQNGDGIFKLGQAAKTPKGEDLVVVRTREFQDFENMLRAMIRQELWRAQQSGQGSGSPAYVELEQKLESFRQQKIADMGLNFFMHELGHVLGLAHNFNESEGSIMGYSTRTNFSDYDADALRVLFDQAGAVKQIWKSQSKLPAQTTKNYVGE